MKKEIQQPTHTIRTDVVNKDTSVKRIELDFCKTDHWSDCWPGLMNIAEMFQSGINRMVRADENTVGSLESILDVKTCTPLESVRFCPQILKPEYFHNSKK